jgi:ProP effector
VTTKTKLANAAIALLAERFPAAFTLFDQHRKPLKIGVHHDIAAAAPGLLSLRRRRIALHRYTHSLGYLGNLRAGVERIDLNGQPAGVIGEEEAEAARKQFKEQLAHLRAWKAGKKAVKPVTTPAVVVGVIAEPKPEAPPAKIALSLAGLRESARRRRETAGAN